MGKKSKKKKLMEAANEYIIRKLLAEAKHVKKEVPYSTEYYQLRSDYMTSRSVNLKHFSYQPSAVMLALFRQATSVTEFKFRFPYGPSHYSKEEITAWFDERFRAARAFLRAENRDFKPIVSYKTMPNASESIADADESLIKSADDTDDTDDAIASIRKDVSEINYQLKLLNQLMDDDITSEVQTECDDNKDDDSADIVAEEHETHPVDE